VLSSVDAEGTGQARSRGRRLASALGVQDAGRALRDFATYLPTQAIPAIAGFLVLPLLAQRLTPTDLGILTIAQTLITFGWTASASWLAMAILRELPAAREQGRMPGFSRTLRVGLAASVGLFTLFAVAVALAGLLSSAVGENLLLVFAATIGLSIQNIAVTLYSASLRPRGYAVVEVLARTGGIAAGIALVFAGYGVGGYLVGLAASSVVVGTIGLFQAWPHAGVGDPTPLPIRPWLHYGLASSAAGLLLWGLFFVDRYLLAALKSTGAVGVYAVGSVIGDKAVTLPTMAFFTAASPLLISAFERHGAAEVARLMRSYTRIILLMGLPIVALLVTSSGILVPALAGTRYYYAAADVAPIVAAGSLLYVLALVANTGLLIAKRTSLLALSAGVGLVVNVAANLALIPAFGIMGSAVATAIGMAAYFAAIRRAARGYASWRFPVGTLARGLCASVAGGGAAVLAMPVTGNGAGQLAIAICVGGVVYASALWLLGERGAGAPA
jgi:O-antigen/teichoic acid export membrane protein